jgi:hypothetical protein
MERSRQELYVGTDSVLMNYIDPNKISDKEKQAQIEAMWKKHDEAIVDSKYEVDDYFFSDVDEEEIEY